MGDISTHIDIWVYKYSPETSLKAWPLSTLSPAQDTFRAGGEALCKDAQISSDKFLSELSDAVPSEGAEK